MAFSEVYQALQTGVVDGQENTPSNIYTQKFYEVQKYTTLTNHGYIGYVVVVNKKFWDGLPADVRGQLEKAMNEATVYSNKIAATENAEGLDEIKKSGKTEIIVPTAAEMAAMRKAMEPLYQDMASRVGKQLGLAAIPRLADEDAIESPQPRLVVLRRVRRPAGDLHRRAEARDAGLRLFHPAGAR